MVKALVAGRDKALPLFMDQDYPLVVLGKFFDDRSCLIGAVSVDHDEFCDVIALALKVLDAPANRLALIQDGGNNTYWLGRSGRLRVTSCQWLIQ
nr:hypothetical protein [Lolliginicoccus lacisalsi]